MTGRFIKRKAKKFCRNIQQAFVKIFKGIPHEIRRFFVKRSITNSNFTVISNNCWGGRVYKYLGLPYLTPTAGLYFFADDYLKFISNLHYYVNLPLRFINPEESKYYDELVSRGDTNRPIGVLDDVEIVFRHYNSKEEAQEKWNRRKQRINYDNIIFKFSRKYRCTEKELRIFDSLPFKNKFFLNNRLPLKYGCEVYWKEKWHEEEIVLDSIPFPGNIDLKKVLNNPPEKYPENGFNISL